MNTYSFEQSRSFIIALILAIICVSVRVTCHQNLASEPYSYHFDPYSYGYETEDNYGSKQWKQERSNHPHEVHGSYGYRDNHGVFREVTYVADQNGFRANIKTNEPGINGSGDKSPASTKIESHSSPLVPQAASSISHPLMGQLYHQEPASHRHQGAAPIAPVYVRQQFAPAKGYYQPNV